MWRWGASQLYQSPTPSPKLPSWSCNRRRPVWQWSKVTWYPISNSVQPVGVCASLHGCGPSGHHRPTTVVLLSVVMSSITFSTASVDPVTCDQVGLAHLWKTEWQLPPLPPPAFIGANASWAREVCFWFLGQRHQWPVPGLSVKLTLFFREQRSSCGSCWWAKDLLRASAALLVSAVDGNQKDQVETMWRNVKSSLLWAHCDSSGASGLTRSLPQMFKWLDSIKWF